MAKLRERSTKDILDRNSSNSCSIAERMAKKRRVCRQEAEYVDTNFILGSAAHVERLWSIAKNVSTCARRRMTPQLLEGLLFLKENERFWDINLVSEAIATAKTELIKDKLATHEELENYI